MLKRVTAFLTVLFMGLVLTVRSPVKADTFSIPFSAIPDLLNAFYTVAAGGKIEFSALIGDFTGIDDFLSNLNEYYDEHYTQPLLQRTQGLIDIGLSGLALEGVDSLDSNYTISIPITHQDIANFMGYDVNWTDRYYIDDSISVNPDLNYIAYLNRINLRDTSDASSFWFYDFPDQEFHITSSMYTKLDSFPAYNYSWVAGSENGFTYSVSNFNSGYCFPFDILTINVNSVNGVYSYSINLTPSITAVYSSFGNDYFSARFSKTNNNYALAGTNDVTTPVNTFTRSFSSANLSDVLYNIALNFKNVNVIVDGDYWSYVGSVSSPGITLNDSIPVGNTGDITYGVYPISSTGDVGLDLAKWGEYLFNKCISGADTLSMDTVIDDGWDLVDTEDGERAITQDDEEDVAKVIHGFIDTTATTPTPTPDIGDPPVLKIIPPILELPDEIWPDGGRDTTVLAQMVHATDVAIPNDIMTVIWSTIGLLVVGGLISILHK